MPAVVVFSPAEGLLRQAPASLVIIALVLALSVLGGTPPRVWCSGHGGHAAVESLSSGCLADQTHSCLRPVAPVIEPAPSGSATPPPATRPAMEAGQETCTDSLLGTQPLQTVTVRIPLSPPLEGLHASAPSLADPRHATCDGSRSGQGYRIATPLDSRTALLI